MRPRILIALCALMLSSHTPSAAAQPHDPAPLPAASITAPYSGPTTDVSAQLKRAIEQARADQLARFYAWAAAQPKPAPRRAARATSSSSASHRGYATAKECVSMVEHGGSYDESTNPSHKGRYQFSRSTWIAYGGVASHWDDWSLASAAEQDEVFERAWSSPGGPENWLPYDGCR